MKRRNLAYRVSEIIHEVTGQWLDEESWLDFDTDHRGKMESIARALRDEFLCVDHGDIPKWETVSNIVDMIVRRLTDEEG